MRITADRLHRERTIVMEPHDIITLLREKGIIPSDVPDDRIAITTEDELALVELTVYFRFMQRDND